MNRYIYLSLLVGVFIYACTAPPTSTINDHTTLKNVADQSNFQYSRNPRQNTFLLEGDSATARFSPGISGFYHENQWYSLTQSPFLEGGQLHLASSDARQIRSILENNKTQQVNNRSQSNFTSSTRIVLDPGHGGIRTGAEGKHGTTEKHIVLSISKKVAEQLRSSGISVILTRNHDETLARQYRMDLDQRTNFIRKNDADLFVSIHANAASTPRAKGVEVFIPPGNKSRTLSLLEKRYPKKPRSTLLEKYRKKQKKSKKLAHAINQNLREVAPTGSRGVKRRNFHVLRTSTSPAVLVETGFLTNPAEARKLSSVSYQQQIAQAIANSILSFSDSINERY